MKSSRNVTNALKMDTTSDTRRKHYDAARGLSFVSPYVEIGDNYNNESPESSPLLGEGSSINSFLDEAEIITTASELNTIKAHDRMRKKLRYFFMNPIQKWNAKRRFPWKLCLQVIKIIFASVQLILFGLNSYRYVTQHVEMTTALSRFFLKDWALDVAVYPPSNGPYAAYTIPEFYENIDNVIRQFSKVSILPIGPYSYDNQNDTLSPMLFCSNHYVGDVFPENSTITIHGKPVEKCVWITPLYSSGSDQWDNFTLESFLKDLNFTLNFKTLVKAQLHFRLRTILIKSMTKLDVPECYKLKIDVSYDNSEHDGQLLISLKIRSKKLSCQVHSKTESNRENASYLLRQFLNSFVIILCLLSGVLCIRSLYKGYTLGGEVVEFFKEYYSKDIPTWEFLDFIDFWYVNIIISDIMLLFGSLIKLQIEERSAEGHEYSKCTVLLGIANLLIWVGLLRYLGFFPKYNMLILALKRALPNVLRFTLCAVFLYLGFCFCGWIVLAPYHVKFRTLSRASECLFSVMNGDDMFATFALVDTGNILIWWFSRFYLYTFLLLFIYVVVSLFISVIMDTFETIKINYLYGSPPKTTVEIFIAAETYSAIPATPSSDRSDINSPGMSAKVWCWLKSKLHI